MKTKTTVSQCNCKWSLHTHGFPVSWSTLTCSVRFDDSSRVSSAITNLCGLFFFLNSRSHLCIFPGRESQSSCVPPRVGFVQAPPRWRCARLIATRAFCTPQDSVNEYFHNGEFLIRDHTWRLSLITSRRCRCQSEIGITVPRAVMISCTALGVCSFLSPSSSTFCSLLTLPSPFVDQIETVIVTRLSFLIHSRQYQQSA